ncbi:unnamed protein product [Heligmosomoides polygyrus]|uniref:Actin maturation protease n=1 Tax=Heligmosomoides polygyrus TaxID=6339 RepID=A0A183F6S8_HELPZ|nr:unnamed protein product [Heligmosomoides polygyrus]
MRGRQTRYSRAAARPTPKWEPRERDSISRRYRSSLVCESMALERGIPYFTPHGSFGSSRNAAATAPCIPADRVVRKLSALTRARIEEVLSRHADPRSLSLPGAQVRILSVQPISQDGPQCGLVALSMATQLLGLEKKDVLEIYDTAKRMGLTIQGEMFSGGVAVTERFVLLADGLAL